MMLKRRFLLVLFLLALAVRLPMLASLHDAYLTGGITTSLGLVARNLLEGRGLAETTGPQEILRLYDLQLAEGRLLDIRGFPNPPDQPTSPLIQRMPGYPVLLAMTFKLAGTYRYLPIQILQVLLSAMLPLFVVGAGRRFFGESAARVAGVLACLNFAEARLAVVPLYDWWVIFVAAWLVWLLSRSMERGYPAGSFAWMGLVLAGGVYLKSTVLALPFFLALFLVPKLGPGRAALRGALLAGLPLLALTPWAVRNDRLFRRPILTNTFFWPTVWEGFGEIPNPFGAVLDDRRTHLSALAVQPDLRYGSPEYDDFFRGKVFAALEGHPGFVASLWVRRFCSGLLFPGNPWGIGGANRSEASYTVFRAETGRGPLGYVLRWPGVALIKVLQRLWDPLLFFMTLLTLASDRKRWREHLPLLAFPVAFLAVTVPLHLEGRYLLPGAPALILFASVPLASWLFSPRRPTASPPVAL